MLYKLSLLVFLALLTACQPLLTPLTHNTPCFTKGGQFEGGINAGGVSGNINLAYTPLKYFAIQANGYACPGFGSGYFTNYAEAAAGLYLPLKKSIIALNAGYGLGTSNWRLVQPGYSGYTMDRARYDSRKYFVQAYMLFRSDSSNKIQKGFSVKYNLFTNTFHSAAVEQGHRVINPQSPADQGSVELTVFYKRRIAKPLYLHFNAGLSVSGEYSAVIVRTGIVFRVH